MALPYTIDVTCKEIADYPGDDIEAATDYAIVRFVLADGESSDDEILKGVGLTADPGEIVFRITQAQKDDFTVGNDYTISMSAA